MAADPFSVIAFLVACAVLMTNFTKQSQIQLNSKTKFEGNTQIL